MSIMPPKIGRNDPCPCGSGRKYKRCCLAKESTGPAPGASSGQFRFEAGSYGSPAGFIPSIACLKRAGGVEHYHFVLVRPEEPSEGEDQASDIAHRDLDNAAARRERLGTAVAFATFLREIGYVRLSDFEIAESGQDANEPTPPIDDDEPLLCVWYRRGFAADPTDRGGLHVTELRSGDLPGNIAAAIRDDRLLYAGGVYGDPLAGDPVQIDELVLEVEGRCVQITVYNRAIMLFQTQEDIYPRVHRTCCQIDLVDPPPLCRRIQP